MVSPIVTVCCSTAEGSVGSAAAQSVERARFMPDSATATASARVIDRSALRALDAENFTAIPPTETTFFEWSAPPWPGGGECVLELEDPGGAKMRVHLKGVQAPDLAALSRSFWGDES